MKRVDFIDTLRGFAIFMVIFNHISVHITQTVSVFCDMCLRWRMPLFFFISGFLIHSLLTDAGMLRNRISNRLSKQLYPTLIVFLIFVTLSSILQGKNIATSLYNAVFDPMKSGYWFTISLVEVFFSFAIFIYIFNKFKANLKQKIFILLSAVSILMVFAYLLEGERLGHGFFGDIVDLLSLVRTLQLALYFYIGIICGIYKIKFIEIVLRKDFAFISLIVFVICYNLDLRICYLVSRIAGVFTVISIFAHLQKYIPEHRITIYLKKIGKLTLPIYLFHYFILFLIKSTPIICLSLITASQYFVFEMATYTLLTLAIIKCSLWIDRLLTIKPSFHKLIFNVSRF